MMTGVIVDTDYEGGQILKCCTLYLLPVNFCTKNYNVAKFQHDRGRDSKDTIPCQIALGNGGC